MIRRFFSSPWLFPSMAAVFLVAFCARAVFLAGYHNGYADARKILEPKTRLAENRDFDLGLRAMSSEPPGDPISGAGL